MLLRILSEHTPLLQLIPAPTALYDFPGHVGHPPIPGRRERVTALRLIALNFLPRTARCATTLRAILRRTLQLEQ